MSYQSYSMKLCMWCSCSIQFCHANACLRYQLVLSFVSSRLPCRNHKVRNKSVDKDRRKDQPVCSDTLESRHTPSDGLGDDESSEVSVSEYSTFNESAVMFLIFPCPPPTCSTASARNHSLLCPLSNPIYRLSLELIPRRCCYCSCGCCSSAAASTADALSAFLGIPPTSPGAGVTGEMRDGVHGIRS